MPGRKDSKTLTIDILFPLLGFAVVSLWTPGPNNITLAASGARFGWRATMPHALGVITGFPLMMFLIALGFGAVFARSPVLRTSLSWIGFGAMLYLAWKIATAGVGKNHSGRGRPQGRPQGRPMNFMEATVFQWINPKAWVLVIGVSTTYVSGASPLMDALIVSTVFLVLGIGSAQTWLLFGVGIRHFLGDGPGLRLFNVVMGGLLAMTALWLVIGK